MEFWHKKPFSICFVYIYKSRKFSNFEAMLDYIMLGNFRTVCPIFLKIAPKVAQDCKEKSHESSRREKKKFHKIITAPGPFMVKFFGMVTDIIWLSSLMCLYFSRHVRKLELHERKYGVTSRWKEQDPIFISVKASLMKKKEEKALKVLQAASINRAFLKELLRKYNGKY